ncbi:ROK family transcriptional regulator [Rhodobium gokarnense]|nr:ROK family transcriptional regulator [Rhodobium gokarnense]
MLPHMSEHTIPEHGKASTNPATQIRRQNRRMLLHALRVRGSLSRAELARATGLTPQAVANIISDLIAGGLVRETGRRKAPRGQPPIAIEIAGDGGYAIGIRIDDKHYHAVVADLSGSLIEMIDGPVTVTAGSDWLDFVAKLHAGFTARFGVDRCLGLGLVTPGPFDVTWPGVPSPGAVPALQSRAVAGALSALTGVDIFIENDATASALGEKLYGEASDIDDFFYIFISEGVGGGIVIGGEPYRGLRGNAGEFGHFIVDPAGPPCYCGNRGCLGEYLSLRAMRAFLAEAEAAGEETGAATKRWMERAAGALSIALASVENLLDPEMVIIGGAVPPAFLKDLVGELGDLRPSVCEAQGRERLRLSALGERSAALGASALPILAATTAANGLEDGPAGH